MDSAWMRSIQTDSVKRKSNGLKRLSPYNGSTVRGLGPGRPEVTLVETYETWGVCWLVRYRKSPHCGASRENQAKPSGHRR